MDLMRALKLLDPAGKSWGCGLGAPSKCNCENCKYCAYRTIKEIVIWEEVGSFGWFVPEAVRRTGWSRVQENLRHFLRLKT